MSERTTQPTLKGNKGRKAIMSKKEKPFKLGLYASRSGKIVVNAYLAYPSYGAQMVRYTVVIPRSQKVFKVANNKTISCDFDCLEIEAFRKKYPLSVDLCIVERV